MEFWLNYQSGKIAPGVSNNQIDLVATGAVSSKFSIGVNGTYSNYSGDSVKPSAAWWGAALYLNYDPLSTFGLTLRSEYFSNKDNALDMSPASSPGNS